MCSFPETFLIDPKKQTNKKERKPKDTFLRVEIRFPFSRFIANLNIKISDV